MSKDVQQRVIRSTVMAAVLLLGFTTMAEARLLYPRDHKEKKSDRLGTELILEAGMVLPLQDLADDYWTTDKGLGATAGYEFGGRLRQYIGSYWAISPSFHFANFGNTSGVGDFSQGDGLAYEVDASLFRYGVDMHVFSGSSRSAIRPYFIGGASLTHYRYQDTLQGYGAYNTSFNAPAFNAGLGFKMRSIEVSGTYHFCPFDTSELPPGLGTESYAWDHVVVRVGFAFGN